MEIYANPSFGGGAGKAGARIGARAMESLFAHRIAVVKTNGLLPPDLAGTALGVSKNASLTFDARSSWKITVDTEIDSLTVCCGHRHQRRQTRFNLLFQARVSDGGAFKFGAKRHGKDEAAGSDTFPSTAKGSR